MLCCYHCTILLLFFGWNLPVVVGSGAPLPPLVDDFFSSGSRQDSAYTALVDNGDLSVIPFIIRGKSSNNEFYGGLGFFDDKSSVVRTTPARLSVMALYLIDAIVYNSRTPYLAPILSDEAGNSESSLITNAIEHYRQWWLRVELIPLDQTRTLRQAISSEPHPFADSKISWPPRLLPSKDMDEGQTGNKQDRSDTPGKRGKGSRYISKNTKDGPDSDSDKDPSHLIFQARDMNGPTPYNALSWALNVRDCWIQPAGDVSWDDILKDYGYDVDNPSPCDDRCDDDLGPKIKMIFHYINSEEPCIDSNWVHAMRMEPGGEWTSKNGASGLYNNISDCNAFLQQHYPTSQTLNEIREVKCFCKEGLMDGSSGGDPHFHTFFGEYFAYHGVCDLVLVRSPTFSSGLGLELHIRTKEREGYSSISNAALRIGTDTLEVASDGTYSINGVLGAPLPTKLAGVFQVSEQANTQAKVFTSDVSHGFTSSDLEESVLFDISLGEDEHIQIQRWKDYLWVNVRAGRKLKQTSGLMGSVATPGKIARDGVTIMEDADEFGQEWQVRDYEPKLFRALETPQHPASCQTVSSSPVRRLGQEGHAEAACAHVEGPMKQFCLYDVMVTGDTEIAAAYGE